MIVVEGFISLRRAGGGEEGGWGAACTLPFFHGCSAEDTLSLQVQRELEEERKAAEEQQRQAQEAIEAKVAELKAIEAVRRQEVQSSQVISTLDITTLWL